MIKNKGVYTTKCPQCSRSILIHVFSDGSFSPNKCSECKLEFVGLNNGEERNTFVLVPIEKESKTEEKNEADKKENTGPTKIKINKVNTKK